MVCKVTFCYELPNIPDKAGRKNEKKKNTGNCKALCVSRKRKNIMHDKIILFDASLLVQKTLCGWVVLNKVLDNYGLS